MFQKNKETETVIEIAKAVGQLGGRVYYVGGCVRDALMQVDCKDIDVEVHGVTVEMLEAILDTVGEKIEFGKSFGVYNLKGCAVDIAMPRKEMCIGNRHTDFKIDVDPFLGTVKAARRRDFSVNALMKDVLTGDIIDHFGGVSDMKNGIIRHVNDETFAEDPLRVFRAAQFAARLDFKIADETKCLCKEMDVSTLSHERVFEEMKKALLKAEKPSMFFYRLNEMEKLEEWFFPVSKLIGVSQNEIHHKEGDVFTHTMMVLDAAAAMRDKVKQPLAFMLATLTHDFGKITATKLINGVTRAYNHETEGLALARDFLLRLTREKHLLRYVLNMVEYHMKPNICFANNSSIKATNKMFDNAEEPLDLIYMAIADSMGKIPMGEHKAAERFLLERLNMYREFMSRPHVEGADLIKAGLRPGPEFSELLGYAHKLRLAGIDKESALKQTLSYQKNIKRKMG